MYRVRFDTIHWARKNNNAAIDVKGLILERLRWSEKTFEIYHEDREARIDVIAGGVVGPDGPRFQLQEYYSGTCFYLHLLLIRKRWSHSELVGDLVTRGWSKTC